MTFHLTDVVILRNYPQAFADTLLLKIAVYHAHSAKKDVVPQHVLRQFIHESDDVLAGYDVITYSGNSHVPTPHVAGKRESKSNKKAIIIGIVVPVTLIALTVLIYVLARYQSSSYCIKCVGPCCYDANIPNKHCENSIDRQKLPPCVIYAAIYIYQYISIYIYGVHCGKVLILEIDSGRKRIINM